MMPTYAEYLKFCESIKRQPLNESAFNALVKIKFCPIKSTYVK